jgi:hypothetical protein
MKNKKDIVNLLRPIIEEHGPQYITNFIILMDYFPSNENKVYITFKSNPKFRKVNVGINGNFKRDWEIYCPNEAVPEGCDDYFCLRITTVKDFFIQWNKAERMLKLKAFL